MIDSADAQPVRRSIWTSGKFAIWFFLIFVLAFFGLMSGALFGPMQAGFALAFGWVQFLGRTIPRISWNWDLIGMTVFCVGIILFLAHSALKWIVGAVLSARGKTFCWPWKWTWCGMVAVGLFFLVGMAVGGAVHQIGWISRSDEPWYETKPRYMRSLLDLRRLEMEVRTALLDAKTVQELRKALWDPSLQVGSRLLQAHHILFVRKESGQMEGVLIFPRNRQSHLQTGGFYTTADESRHLSANEVIALIERERQNLVAF